MTARRGTAGPPDDGPAPRVSVVIPVGGGRAHLARCLWSVAALDPAPEETLLVVDGGEPPELPVESSDVRVLHRPERGGPAAARNDGARAARGDVLLFLDADVTVPPGLVAGVTSVLADPTVTGVIGSYDDRPGHDGLVSRYRNLLHHHVHQSSRREATTFWGACGAVRRDAFLAVGGFDEAYDRPSVEDIELGYRLVDAGHRLVLDPGLQVKHWKRWTLPGMVVTDVARRGIPWSLLLLRRREMRNDLNLRTTDRVAVAATCGAVAAAVPAPPVAAALLAVATLMDRELLAFLARRAGPGMALAAVPLRWLFHLYSAAAFGAALVLHATGRTPARTAA